MLHQLLPFSLLFSFLVLIGSTKAQNFEWAKSMGGAGYDRGNSITVDGLGNIYTTGFFEDTVDFDPDTGIYNLISDGHSDFFVSKFNKKGNLLWVKKAGEENGDKDSYSIEVDVSGNIYLTGSFSGTVDFDPGSGIFNLKSTSRRKEIFVSKLDSSGNFLWAKKLGGTSSEEGQSISLDALGNIYITGFFEGEVDFDPSNGIFNLNSSGSTDIFVCKLDPSGNFIWAKKMGGTSWDQAYSIAVDNSGNVYTTGFFSETVDFDPGPGTFNLSSNGSYDIFISKLDSAGDLVWAKGIGGTQHDQANSISVDAFENVYTTGRFENTVDFDPGISTFTLNSTGDSDIFLSKLDASGSFSWAKKMGGVDSDIGYSIALDRSGNVYSTGFFTGTADFDPGTGVFNLISNGNLLFDIFISKLDSSGKFIWSKGIGGKGLDLGGNIFIDPSKNIYLTGLFEDTVDFYPGSNTSNLVAVGEYDIFISKWSQCNTNTIITKNEDSLVANQQGAAYQWLNCDSSFKKINGATESFFNPIENGFYACEITLNSCVDTSNCIQVIINSIPEELLQLGIKIYPNPVIDFLSIEVEQAKPSTRISIRDVKGQVVYTNENVKAGKTQIDASHWAKGLYFVRIIEKDFNKSIKIINN